MLTAETVTMKHIADLARAARAEGRKSLMALCRRAEKAGCDHSVLRKVADAINARAAAPSLGPSNDAPLEVQVEIRAAEIAHSGLYIGDEAAGGVDYFTEADRSTDEDWLGWNAGWLAREIASHYVTQSGDHDAWSWDPTRPVSGQYEEWYARSMQPCGDCDRCATGQRCDLAYPIEPSLAGGNIDHSDAPRIVCPVQSGECAIRNTCTNACGQKDGVARRLAEHIAPGIADRVVEVVAQENLDGAPTNAIGELCNLLKASGLTMTLHGQPIDEAGLRAYVAPIVDAKLARIAEQTRHDVAASVARHAELPGAIESAALPDDLTTLPVLDLDDAEPPVSTGYSGQGSCESCHVAIEDGDRVRAYTGGDDHVVMHEVCPRAPVDAGDVGGES